MFLLESTLKVLVFFVMIEGGFRKIS